MFSQSVHDIGPLLMFDICVIIKQNTIEYDMSDKTVSHDLPACLHLLDSITDWFEKMLLLKSKKHNVYKHSIKHSSLLMFDA